MCHFPGRRRSPEKESNTNNPQIARHDRQHHDSANRTRDPRTRLELAHERRMSHHAAWCHCRLLATPRRGHRVMPRMSSNAVRLCRIPVRFAVTATQSARREARQGGPLQHVAHDRVRQCVFSHSGRAVGGSGSVGCRAIRTIRREGFGANAPLRSHVRPAGGLRSGRQPAEVRCASTDPRG
jgi:hypothetical protein